MSAVADGVTFGGYGGWKYMSGGGFTFVAQLVTQAVGIGASAEDSDTGEKADASGSDVVVLLNLDLGWSF